MSVEKREAISTAPREDEDAKCRRKRSFEVSEMEEKIQMPSTSCWAEAESRVGVLLQGSPVARFWHGREAADGHRIRIYFGISSFFFPHH